MSDHPKIAAIAGATGLIGRALTEALLASAAFDQVITFTRQAPGFEHPKLRAIELPDFNRIGETVAQLETLIAEGFSALGTTIKTAGSQEAFRRVDCDFNSAFAAACEGAGARAFNLVSSVGADAHSSNFYLHCKGETEKQLIDLRFEHLRIFRPSLLIGARKEERIGEGLGQLAAPFLSPLLLGPLRLYKPIKAVEVARAMAKAAESGDGERAVNIYHYDEMMRLLRR